MTIHLVRKNGLYYVFDKNYYGVSTQYKGTDLNSAKSIARYLRDYPLKASTSAMNVARREADQRVLRKLGKKRFSLLKRISHEDPFGKTSTIYKYQNNPKRIAYRNMLIDKVVNKKGTLDRKHPDLYIFGGIAGSGKGSVLRKKVPEKAVVIDPDIFKSYLANTNRSPIKGYRLAHANRLHEESSLLAKEAQNRAMQERRDVILDTTLANLKGAVKKIHQFRHHGYTIHLLGTQLSPVNSMRRTAIRFLKHGRYVPPRVIMKTGNEINSNVLMARRYANDWYIVDTTKRKARVVSSKGW